MPAVDVASLGPFMLGAEPDLASTLQPVRIVEATLSCLDAERLFVREHSSSLAVVDGEGRLGLLQRDRFLGELSGRLGYGRALNSRTCVGVLVDWDALVVPVDCGLPDAARLAIARAPGHRYDDVLVESPQGIGVVSTARLIEAMAGMIAHRSVRDPLTGLATRDLLFHRLQELCAAVAGTTDRLAVVYVDLDDFKSVNDTRGHAVGDRMLTAVAWRLERAARPGDLVGRLGGDEFVVVIPMPPIPEGSARGAALELGERFLSAVLEDPEDGTPGCGASVGVALSRPGEADPESLLREADMVMYSSKRAGGGSVRVNADVVPTFAPTGKGLLAEALRHDWVRVHAQPIVDATTGEIVSLEVLARVQHPERGTALPATFLADARPAERLALDSRVLADSLRALREHQQESGCSSPPYLNANLSLESLARPDLAEHVLGLLGRYDVDPSRLRLEVPELADLTTVQDAAPQLRALRSAGVAVTLDDLGAGSTSLRHLSALAIDGIKIDLSFVAGIVDNERDLAVVRMLIDLGAGLGLAVTAEGVETQDQLRLLRELGCPYVQGYLVGRPRPLSEALDAVAAGSPHVHLPG